MRSLPRGIFAMLSVVLWCLPNPPQTLPEIQLSFLPPSLPSALHFHQAPDQDWSALLGFAAIARTTSRQTAQECQLHNPTHPRTKFHRAGKLLLHTCSPAQYACVSNTQKTAFLQVPLKQPWELSVTLSRH